MKKYNLKGLTLNELEDFVVTLGEQKFRGRQLFDWLYAKECDSFANMSTLSKTVRERLESVAEICSITLQEWKRSSEDETLKYLFELSDHKRIESVLIPPRTAFESPEAVSEEEQTRLTVCLSTQVGCPLDCRFCATASMGFLRNLTVGEIIDQLLQVKRHSGKRVTNLVYMGMGEPMANYEHVMKSVEIFITGMNIAARRITISTAGWVPGILRMADEQRKVKLALSLHSLNDQFRSQLMPVNIKYPLPVVLHAIEYYYAKVKRRITFEYILFDGLNDREEDLRGLIGLSKRIPCKINIIPFHPISAMTSLAWGGHLRPTPVRRAERFVEQLRQNYVTVFVRSSSGEDISAACGQLAVLHDKKQNEKTIRISAPRHVIGKTN